MSPKLVFPLLTGRVAAPAQTLPKQYAVYLSEELCHVLDCGITRAMLERSFYLNTPDPVLIDNQGDEAYHLSLAALATHRYRRAAQFSMDTLLGYNQVLWEGAGHYVGTLKQLDTLSAWVEHELDYLTLNPTAFIGYRYSDGRLIPAYTIHGWMVDLVDQIDRAPEQIIPVYSRQIGPSLTTLLGNWFIRIGFAKE